MRRVLSGIQPTGDLHIGNYFGAIRNWITLQDTHECLFCIVDLHAITVPYSPEELRRNNEFVAAAYIASGIDPKKSAIFVQSQPRTHSQLFWFLACHTPMGWLNRMTQFKEKAGKKKDQASLGLYAYPVLMAADILLYDAHDVPVGEDQKQHLELARDIAQSINQRYATDLFRLPEPMLQGPAPRVMSLRDGASKMSKSDPSAYSHILLRDDADTLAQKIRKAKTDPQPLPETLEDLEGRPEARNLLTLLAACTGQSLEDTCQAFAGKQFSDLKEALTEAMSSLILPIGQEMKRLLNDDRTYLQGVLKEGAEKANHIGHKKMAEVEKVLGF
ncbi:tryptophan--tRNA ligase [Alphaproteobacteria bacterium]|nr:tryptophan--tRNA ligase [Alphaproteobacteria bacterium]